MEQAENKVQLRILMNHLKKEATDPGNFDDAAIHHNENASLEPDPCIILY